jgi:hypothetical protein
VFYRFCFFFFIFYFIVISNLLQAFFSPLGGSESSIEFLRLLIRNMALHFFVVLLLPGQLRPVVTLSRTDFLDLKGLPQAHVYDLHFFPAATPQGSFFTDEKYQQKTAFRNRLNDATQVC